MRLSLLCGPSTGMQWRRPGIAGVVDSEAAEQTHAVSVEAGHCYRVFAVAEASVEDLELELRGGSGEVLELVNRGEPWAVIPADRPHCVERAGRLGLALRAHGGRGDYSVQVWQFKR